jgi:hypothetical protein
MKLSAGILLVTLTAGGALAQNPNILQNVQDKMNAVQQQKKAAGDEALNLTASPKTPAAKPAAATAAKPGAVTAKPAAPASSTPATAAAKPANAPAAARPVPAVSAKASSTPKPAAPNAQAPGSKVAVAAPAAVAKKQGTPVKAVAANIVPAKKDDKPATQALANTDAKNDEAAKTDDASDKKDKDEDHYITAGNRRDPFVSPIVQHMTSAGCSTGKRCLAIDQIALRGIVKSDAGMIAVVVNSLDKAYFLRENDPVFNGYVMKISGDSVVFKETIQDKLGHLSTREVVKKITTPAV